MAELSENIVLRQAAYAKAQDMLTNQYFAHVSPDGQGLANWLKKSGYDYLAAGENLAIGFEEPEAVVKAWQASPTHQANLVDGDFKEIGVATINGEYEGENTNVVVQLFGYPAKLFNIETKIPAVAPAKKVEEPVVKKIEIAKEASLATLPEVLSSVVDNQAAGQSKNITVDVARSSVTSQELANGSWLVSAEVFWSQEPVWAVVNFGDYSLELQPDPTVSGRWFGQLSGVNSKDLHTSVITMASVSAQDEFGNTILTDISWLKRPTSNISDLKQYSWVREKSQGLAGAVFKISDLLYRIMAIVFGLVIVCCIVFGWKRTRRQAIFSAVSMLFLFLLLILI